VRDLVARIIGVEEVQYLSSHLSNYLLSSPHSEERIHPTASTVCLDKFRHVHIPNVRGEVGRIPGVEEVVIRYSKDTLYAFANFSSPEQVFFFSLLFPFLFISIIRKNYIYIKKKKARDLTFGAGSICSNSFKEITIFACHTKIR
jgi:hypothetical protein